MDTRPGENTGVHVSGAQVLGIRDSLLKHIHKRLEQRLEQLHNEEGEEEGEEAQENDIQELKNFLVKNIEGQFIDTLMNKLCNSCIVDDFNYQEREDDTEEIEENDDNRKVEPYDFALNDKLRTTYQQFEDIVEDICHLRSEIPPELSQKVHEQLTNDVSIIQHITKERVNATNTILQSLETQPSSYTTLDNMHQPVDISTLHSVKNNFNNTVLSTETISRVAQFH